MFDILNTLHFDRCAGLYILSDRQDSLRPSLTLCLVITNSVASVRERTIPTERPPLVGEVSANLCG
jgi:hypothetical protein